MAFFSRSVEKKKGGYRQHCHLGNTGSECSLGLFQDDDFAGDLADSKSTLGSVLCFFGKPHIRAD